MKEQEKSKAELDKLLKEKNEAEIKADKFNKKIEKLNKIREQLKLDNEDNIKIHKEEMNKMKGFFNIEKKTVYISRFYFHKGLYKN